MRRFRRNASAHHCFSLFLCSLQLCTVHFLNVLAYVPIIACMLITHTSRVFLCRCEPSLRTTIHLFFIMSKAASGKISAWRDYGPLASKGEQIVWVWKQDDLKHQTRTLHIASHTGRLSVPVCSAGEALSDDIHTLTESIRKLDSKRSAYMLDAKVIVLYCNMSSEVRDRYHRVLLHYWFGGPSWCRAYATSSPMSDWEINCLSEQADHPHKHWVSMLAQSN